MAKKLYSIRLDPALVKVARRTTKAATDSEAVRRILWEHAEVEKFARFLDRWGGKFGPRAFEASLYPRPKPRVRRRA